MMRKPDRGAGVRAVRILQCVAELEDEFTVSVLAQRVGLAPSTVHRLLQSLIGPGMIERSGGESYRPGRELFRMASLLTQRFDIRAIARPILQELWSKWQETCALCSYDSDSQSARVMDTIASVHPLQYVIQPAATLSLAWGSLGRSILAWLPDEAVDIVLARSKLGPLSGVRAPPRAAILAELRRIRRQGYARYEDRTVLNIAGIAAPVFSGAGAVSGSIGVTMPLTRFKRCDSNALSEAVVAAARRVSAALGATNNTQTPERTRKGRLSATRDGARSKIPA
jgi:DNA-binding IclR family transcriptional regulator